jgi:hypothetical protein
MGSIRVTVHVYEPEEVQGAVLESSAGPFARLDFGKDASVIFAGGLGDARVRLEREVDTIDRTIRVLEELRAARIAWTERKLAIAEATREVRAARS